MKHLRSAFINAMAAFFATRGTAAIKDFGLKEYLSVSKDLPHSENQPWKLVGEMPYNCHFQPWIEVEAPAGKVIDFNSSNPLVLYLTKTESCTTRSGTHTYEAKEWVSREGAIYTIPSGVTVKAVRYRETGYDTRQVGSFECNDNDYNILWKKAARTAYLCMRDHFYDCPDRERVGFLGRRHPPSWTNASTSSTRHRTNCARSLCSGSWSPSCIPASTLNSWANMACGFTTCRRVTWNRCGFTSRPKPFSF